MKTPAQILNDHTPLGKGYHSTWIIPAMQAYADQQLKEYKEYCHTRGEENCYIKGATAEHERLQEQLKEKEGDIGKLNEFISASQMLSANQNQSYRHTIENLKAELKAAQELNRELVEMLTTLHGLPVEYLTAEEWQKIESLMKKAI